MSETKRAAVIGAGLVGVATAIGLRQSGFDVEIFERRPVLVPDGFGIAITTNGMIALRELGIADQLSEVGARIDRAEFRDPQDRLITDIPLKRVALAQGDYSYGFTRPRLHGRLLELLGDVPIHTGAALSKVTERGNRVVASFEDGRAVEADLVVGADGVHSTVRRCLHGSTDTENSGYVAWLAIAQHVSDKLPPGYGAQWWGRGLRYSVQYAGPGLTYWWGTQTIPNTEQGRRRKLDPISKPGIDKEQFRALFRTWSPKLRSLIDEYLECTAADAVVEINPRCHVPIASWSRGHVTLSGDAAHAMFPSLGTGASIGFEDAAVLMHCVRREREVPAALALYDKLRVERTNRLLKLAKQFCYVETSANPVLVKVRDAYFRVIPRGVMASQLLSFTDFQLPAEIAPPAVRPLGANERWHWFSGQLNPLNTLCALRLRAARPLAAADFEAALRRLQEVHEILNLTVKPSAGQGLEYRRVSRPIAYEQLELVPRSTALDVLNRYANLTFAPDAPLAKLVWAPLSADGSEGLLCLICSHLVADGTAMVRLTQELVRLISDPAHASVPHEPLPRALESVLGDQFSPSATRRALVTQVVGTTGNLLRPGLRLPPEARADFEDLTSRFLRLELDEARTAQLDALRERFELSVGDLAVAGLVRALGAELGAPAARIRVGRSYSFRDLLAPADRDALQSCVAQAAAPLETDSRAPLHELAQRARAHYERLSREGAVLDGLRVLHDTCPNDLRGARRFAAMIQKSGPMHVSVTDLSEAPLRTPAGRVALSEVSLATTLSVSGSLVLVIQRAGGRVSFTLGHAHPLVSHERAARILAGFQRELDLALLLPLGATSRPRAAASTARSVTSMQNGVS